MRSLWILVALLSAATAGCRAEEDPRPDVLLVTVDTLRADRLGAYGSEHEASPSIDGLAAGGVVFERAIAASSRTAPSHASILCSRFVRGHSIGADNGGTRLEGVATLAEVFGAAGYETAAFVGNIMLKSRVGLDLGFALYDDDLPDAEANRAFMFERGARETTERALAWLGLKRSEPTFMWVHYQDPHGPYTPPEGHIEHVRVPVPEDEEEMVILSAQHGWGGIPAYQALGELRLASEYERLHAAEVRYLDDWLGRLLAAAEHEAGPGGVIVLLTADHGEALGEEGFHFAHGHATTPDQSRVPLILRAAELTPGRSDELVGHVDVMPTLLELAGLALPAGMRGTALGSLWREGSGGEERSLFCDIGVEVGAYRDGLYLRHRRSGGRPVSETFRWTASGDWQSAEANPALTADLAAYLRESTPMIPAGNLGERDLDRLRALGYVEPASED